MISYDEMLDKMNLSYFNGRLYESHTPNTEVVERPEQSYIYNKYFKPHPDEPYQPKTKEEYLEYLKFKMNERKRIQQEQKEKRKLLISATNGSLVKVNAPSNSLFRLKMSN